MLFQPLRAFIGGKMEKLTREQSVSKRDKLAAKHVFGVGLASAKPNFWRVLLVRSKNKERQDDTVFIPAVCAFIIIIVIIIFIA